MEKPLFHFFVVEKTVSNASTFDAYDQYLCAGITINYTRKMTRATELALDGRQWHDESNAEKPHKTYRNLVEIR